jgi:peptidoglycan/LPS O-acetylase OafA/YrhL
MNPALSNMAQQTGATPHARIFIFLTGVLLLVWTLSKLRNRSLLVSLGSIFVSMAAGLIAFAIVPDLFNEFSYFAGVHYPPLLYLIGAVVVLTMLSVHLAARLSMLDVRCRRMAQQMALDDALRRENTSEV